MDQAWLNFCAHIHSENTVEKAGEREKVELRKELTYPVARKRGVPLSFWGWSAAAVLCALCVGVSIHLWPQLSLVEMVVVQNFEDDKVLVTTLPDGSVALLSGKSKLTHPQSFASNQRLVTLEGEAFFDINRDERRPFTIETDRVTVEVLGTSFRLRSDETCPFELTVKSGIVKVVLMNMDQNVYAEAGEQVHLIANWLQKSYVEDVGHGVHRLYFIDEPLGQIIRVVNACVQESVQLAIEDESLLRRNFTVTLDIESIEGIAELLCNVLSMKQKMVGNIIYIGKE